MGLIIEESGMKFGEYQDCQVFHIERSEQYINGLRQNGIKTCEFILQRGSKLFFIEAKSSCPRKSMKDIPISEREKRKKSYDDFIQEIILKMRHALSLYGNILLKRYSQKDLPPNMAVPDLSDSRIYLVLVINPPEGSWEPEPELQDDLRKACREVMKIWKIYSLAVINEEMARKKHFIL